jgi:hypothetical protein
MSTYLKREVKNELSQEDGTYMHSDSGVIPVSGSTAAPIDHMSSFNTGSSGVKDNLLKVPKGNHFGSLSKQQTTPLVKSNLQTIPDDDQGGSDSLLANSTARNPI